MGGMTSGGSLIKGESRGGDEGYGERIEDIVLHQWSDNSCLPVQAVVKQRRRPTKYEIIVNKFLAYPLAGG